MTFSYNSTVPNGPDDPGDDQPFMLNNTVSIANLINVEHIGFNLTNGGIHRKVTMPLNTGVPATNVGQLVLFNTNFGVGSPSQLLYSKDNTGRAVIMTGPQDPVAATNGYTFLLGPTPNAIIMQWGKVSQPSATSGSVSFNIAFPNNVFNVSFTLARNASSTDSMWINTSGTNNLTQFAWKSSTSLSNASDFFYWTAIGN